MRLTHVIRGAPEAGGQAGLRPYGGPLRGGCGEREWIIAGHRPSFVPYFPAADQDRSTVKMAKEPLQLNVLISGGFAGAYEQLLPEFQRMSGIKVTTGSGASQGSGPQTIAAQLGRGVAADVVILSREGLSELIAAKMIAAGTDVDLARVRLGVAVCAGTGKPDVSTVEGFEQALLQAKSVAIPGSTAGIWLTHDLFPRLGITERVNIKLTQRGTDATAMVAGGNADLAVLPVSEILHAAGVDLAGRIAPEIPF